MPPLPTPRRSAASREARRIRIMAMLRNGASYDEIAAFEKLSRERVRQIVVQSLQQISRSREDHGRIQAARLEPALKLALSAIADGRTEAIDRLLRVLGAQDKYLASITNSFAVQDMRPQLLQRMQMLAREAESRLKKEASEASDAAQPAEKPQNDQRFPWPGVDLIGANPSG